MTKPDAAASAVVLPDAAIRLDASTLELRLTGRFDAQGVAAVWSEAIRLAEEMRGIGSPVLDASDVSYLDGAGAALIMELIRRLPSLSLRGMPSDAERYLALFDTNDFRVAPPEPRRRLGLIEDIGRRGSIIGGQIREMVVFTGECSLALLDAARKPHKVRWKDVLSVAEAVGAEGVPIIVLIGFLMGLVMAFQSAVPLKRFGAELYVADLLGLAMVRELGTLVTCILLAGRSGSAFAAEIGTMKVGEEVNALTTMGLDPLRFLAVPRVLATLVMTPLLTVFFNLFALIGGAFVVLSFGYPLVTYVNKVMASVTLGDLGGGLFKALVFSLLVSGIGCQRGLATGMGATAVGRSTTSAVVSGLVLIAVADGVFAVMFYALGI